MKIKRLIPALAMLLIAAMLMGTSTFAWFSMNQTVTATGMKVRTEVKKNLLIAEAPSGAAGTSKAADNAFKTSYVTDLNALLEPTSTVNGKNYFYTDKGNVGAAGAANTATYIAYNPANTGDFNTNAGTTGAVGYVDYAVEIKADNTSAASAYLNLTNLNLVYGTTTAGDAANGKKAFRAAILVEDLTSAHNNATGEAGLTLVSLLKVTGGNNWTDNAAVSATDTVSAIGAKEDAAANIATVAARTTGYYKVVIRLWLEGEDETCNNQTFAALTDKWALDVKFQLDDSTGGATIITATDHAKVDLSADSASATTKVIDGQTYYQLTTNTDYYSNATPFADTSRVFTITDNHPTEVTQFITLPAAP